MRLINLLKPKIINKFYLKTDRLNRPIYYRPSTLMRQESQETLGRVHSDLSRGTSAASILNGKFSSLGQGRRSTPTLAPGRLFILVCGDEWQAAGVGANADVNWSHTSVGRAAEELGSPPGESIVVRR
ncbi:PREDICTED: uncharacterized protein LOC105367346 [Ceratosolen solmsi marchali]|uniref:Uncharacterized protein LOC105367346 n=1 Tax=Ceratosolen solmsi marchali TaxID=326594 RepID=A0AAJ7E1F9_9HYME|nr:PREDICTED: uncharacterized protein LOC105367346 [Ceratosolen solmsi marchali]